MSRPAAHRSASRPLAVALLIAAVLAVLAGTVGCGGDDGRQGAGGSTVALTPREDAAAAGRFDASAVFREASPGVVTIISMFGGNRSSGGQGSGFVISDRGEIATNAHVVTSGENHPRPAESVFVKFADGNQVEAKLVGFDPDADVALLKVPTAGLKLRALGFGDERELKVGDPVAAIGSPFGEEQSLSVGVVSATDRSVDSLTDFQIDGAVQTDAAINRGNSGGPLLDARARVVGINQQIDTSSGGGEGVGFAVPASLVTRSIDALRRHGRVDYAFLGVSTTELYPQLARRLKLGAERGALVADVTPGGPADRAGIHGGDRDVRFQDARETTGGDVIVAIDGDPVRRENDLSAIVARKEPGEKVEVELVRGTEKRTVDVTLGRRPAQVR